MFQCRYSIKVFGHYGKSLKDSFFCGGREERLCGGCVCVYFVWVGLF